MRGAPAGKYGISSADTVTAPTTTNSSSRINAIQYFIIQITIFQAILINYFFFPAFSGRTLPQISFTITGTPPQTITIRRNADTMDAISPDVMFT